MSSLQKAESAHELYKGLVSTLQTQRLVGVYLGKYLWQLKADNLYQKAIGSGVETWNDFLKLPEISMEVREATRAMELYETFVVKYGYTADELAEAKTKSLHYLLPHAKSGDISEGRIRELVEDAKVLTQNQFRENIFDAKTGDQGLRTYQFVLMRKCNETGTLQKVHDVNHEQIVEMLGKLGITVKDLLIPDIL